MVSVEINESGMVEDIHVTRAVGLGLEDSAVDAIKQWRFEPARLGTKPLSVQIPIEVNFYMGSKLKTLSDY